MNNRGFVVSGLLYTILFVFLLTLALLLSSLSSNTDLIRRANNDVVDGKDLLADVITLQIGQTNEKSNQIRIKSRYGIMYFPKDFGEGTYDEENNACVKNNISIRLQDDEGENTETINCEALSGKKYTINDIKTEQEINIDVSP